MNSETEDIDLTPRVARNTNIKLSIVRTLEAEKRTHLAELRTGTAILAIPMSLLTILIATSNYYELANVLFFVMGLVVGIIGLIIMGTYFIYRSLKQIRKTEQLRDVACAETSEIAESGYVLDHRFE
ncbi:MAG: hypothetical protein KGY80_02225 [Candidatus Thorarchaeota archaeon]|nr:hypothetical protein [Candidatus Thorarchaeota archaeon]